MLLAEFALGQSTVTTMSGSADTLVNTTPDYVVVTPTLFYEQISFQAVVTKVSGTVAGYAVIQGSNDGTNYLDVNTDSLLMTNVTTNTKVFVLTYNSHLHYRIKFVGSGTMSAKIFGYALTSGGRAKKAIGTPTYMLSSYSLTSDTCTNSATTYVGLPVLNWYQTVSIQVVVTKISGTVAGTVTVQGSVDGTNYVTVSSSFSTAQTLSPSNQATNTKLFTITGSPYKYYRLSYTGTGTMSATIKGYLLANR